MRTQILKCRGRLLCRRKAAGWSGGSSPWEFLNFGPSETLGNLIFSTHVRRKSPGLDVKTLADPQNHRRNLFVYVHKKIPSTGMRVKSLKVLHAKIIEIMTLEKRSTFVDTGWIWVKDNLVSIQD